MILSKFREEVMRERVYIGGKEPKSDKYSEIGSDFALS